MEERDKDIITQNQAEDEIDLIEIARKLWAGRKLIIRVTLVFVLLGFVIVLFTPNYYTASSTMVPQTGDKKASGSLSGLAAIAGINIGAFSTSEVLAPIMYPIILRNVNFQKQLIYSEYNIKKSAIPVTYYDYASNKKYHQFNIRNTIKKYSTGLPTLVLKSLFPNNSLLENVQSIESKAIKNITYSENLIIKALLENLRVNVNERGGYVTISFTCFEPKLCAEIVLRTQTLLQEFLTEFKLEKVRSNLVFVENSFNEAKQNFETKQAELAKFRDANKSLTTAMARTQEEKLTSEYNLLLSVYTELAKQKEQAKIAVTETTPILTIIEPVKIPVDKSGPKRSLILIGFVFTGFLIGSLCVFYSDIKYHFKRII